MAQVGNPGKRRWLATAVALVLAGGIPLAGSHAQDIGLDQQAREAAWAGRIGEGLVLIERHLADHPEDRAARLDRARFLAWRGDYAAASEALDAAGGVDAEVRGLRARIHAWAHRRNMALALNAPLYEADPADFDTAYTQALAARLGEWPQESLQALADVVAARPDGEDTRDLARAVRLPLFSGVGMPVSVYDDSDDIRIRSVGIEGDLRLGDRWRLLGQAIEREHSAPSSGPFAPVTGGNTVDETRIGVGVRHAPSPSTSVELLIGRSDLAPGRATGVGHAQWSHRLDDEFKYALRVERDRVAASPRSLSLGVTRNRVGVATEWRPTLRDTLRASVATDELSDGNHRRGLDADYRHAAYRGERVNVDVGGQLEWSGYSRDPGNGYYSPDRYVRVAPLASAYVKLGDDVGLYVQGTLGAQRDESFGSWKRAADVSGELTVGIFSHWQLVAQAAYSERFNEFGGYEGTRVGLELRYRFCEFRGDRCPRAAGR
jgi:hypothetical protein